jgi:phosphoenolpyruvate carboxylase
MKSNRLSPLPMREDSVAGTIDALLLETASPSPSFSLGGMPSEQRKREIYDSLLRQKVDIVLTAHPTEVNRRTLLRKYRSITEILSMLDRKDITPFERSQTLYSLKREIASIWSFKKKI